jgi:signal transduction histidine kinase
MTPSPDPTPEAQAARVKQLTTLMELSRLLADPGQALGDKLQACLAVLARQARAEQASIMLVEGPQLVVAAATNPRLIGQATPLSEATISTRVVCTGQAICLPDLADSDLAALARRGQESRYRTSSLISLPLLADGVAVGVLNLADKVADKVADKAAGETGGQPFTPADLELARDMAGQVAGLVHFSVLHSRLLAAHQRLRREQREKDELMHLIIHDLKAPLTAAREALSLLGPESGLDQAERDQFRALAEADLELLWRRVTNLLDLQRMDQERLPMQPTPLRLAAIAAEAAARLAPAARVRGVQLGVAGGDDPEVVADEDLLERVLVNLLFNALKVSSPEEGGGGWVRVRVGLVQGGAVVEVADSGPGVDPALGERVFERHVQGAPGRGSSGLGLYFCRRAAALMGGAVAFVNPPEGGARFTLTLPAASA